VPVGTLARRVALGAALSATLLAPAACGDDQPGFCAPFAEVVELEALTTALGAGDLEVARAEARRLDDLADQAPAEIRPDLAALTGAVVDIVELLEAEDPPGRGAEALNERLAELDRRAIAVEDWALENCGLRLR
jgi:hypothetical protein